MRARTVVCLVQLLAVVAVVVDGCGPGRGAGRGRGPRKLTPLVFKQHVPNVSENTLTASGLSEGRIDRNENDTRFKDLVLNYNEDIIFKDEEGTGADRLMTQRCNEKLNTLAISVMNQWPGVHLRVTEGWDEDGHHATNSLHYEGRAVDITTSDRDRSKYGMLARLAVEAGFDWVYYESRAHIHCSVKSESSQAAKYGGCFTSTSTVRTSTGDTRLLSELRIGERILTHDPATNKLAYSEVLAFLDYDPLERREFFRIHLRSGRTITVTPNHLLLTPTTEGVVFARDLSNGDRLLVADDATGSVQHDVVASMDAVVKTGVFAPLTATGTVVVDGIVASCYATVDSQELAHWAYGPYRVLDNLRRGFGRLWSVAVSPVQSWGSEERVERTATRGVHWYAKVLYTMAEVIIPQRLVVV